jgi:hypothetical protein
MAIVDLKKMQREASAVGVMLRRHGLPSDMGEVIALLAGTIRDHRHFQTLLTSVEGEDRHELYESVRPHLRFTANPLDWYISEAGKMAEREKLPILSADGKLLEFRPAQDISSAQKHAQGLLEKALAERTLAMRCGKCTAQETFYGHEGQTRVDVILKARRAGWIYDGTGEKPIEICPACETPLRAAHEVHYGKPPKIVNA